MRSMKIRYCDLYCPNEIRKTEHNLDSAQRRQMQVRLITSSSQYMSLARISSYVEGIFRKR
jgi:hypothetical protein